MGTAGIDLSRALATTGWISEVELRYLADLSYSLPAGSVIAEIGSFKGRSANALALNPNITLYCIDPWTKYSFGDFTSCYDEFIENTRHLRNIVTLRDFSLNAVHRLVAMKFHAVFIDGDHDAEHVRADILAWRPQLTEGGILFGHDYGRPDWPDVEAVVKELVPSYRVVPNTTIWTTEGA